MWSSPRVFVLTSEILHLQPSNRLNIHYNYNQNFRRALASHLSRNPKRGCLYGAYDEPLTNLDAGDAVVENAINEMERKKIKFFVEIFRFFNRRSKVSYELRKKLL